MDLLDHLLVPSSPPSSSPAAPSSPTYASFVKLSQTMTSTSAALPSQPPPQPHPQNENSPPPRAPGLEGVFSIEEFERQHADQRAQIDAKLAARRERASHKLLSARNPNVPSIHSDGTTGNAASELQNLTPLGKPRTTEHTIAFHQLCQAKGLVPSFEFPEEVVGQRFGFRVEVAGRVLEERGPWGSKREAKEAACQSGLEVLRGLSPQENGGGAEGGDALAAAGGGGGGQEEGFDAATGKAWVSLLSEWSAATKTPQPLYQEYALGQRFACTCTLALNHSSSSSSSSSAGASSIVDLLTDIPQGPQTFGTKATLFTSKKIARASCAREAVEWLRRNGQLSETEPPSKRAKLGSPGISAREGKASGNAGSNSNTHTNTNAASTSTSAPAASTLLSKDESEGYGPLVNALCVQLGLQTPEYRLSNSTDVPGFWSGAAYFPRELGTPAEGIASIRNVYGKKRAKEECAKGVVEYLRGLLEQRKASGGAGSGS